MSLLLAGGISDLSNEGLLIILLSFPSSNSKPVLCIHPCCSVKVIYWIVSWEAAEKDGNISLLPGGNKVQIPRADLQTQGQLEPAADHAGMMWKVCEEEDVQVEPRSMLLMCRETLPSSCFYTAIQAWGGKVGLWIKIRSNKIWWSHISAVATPENPPINNSGGEWTYRATERAWIQDDRFMLRK